MKQSCTPPLRVLNLLTSLGVGGIERYLLRVIQAMDPAYWAHEVLCKSGYAGELASEYEKAKVPIHLCRQEYFSPSSWWRLRHIIRQGCFDVVCDFTGDFAGIPMTMARLVGVPKRITWYRSSDVHYRRGFRDLYARFIRMLVRQNSTDILSNSKANLDAFHPGWEKHNGVFEVIANGVPVEPFASGEQRRKKVRDLLGVSIDTQIIGHVGSFRYAKNHECILKAAAIVCAQHDNVLFMLVGDGELRPMIADEIERLNLRDRFLLLGNRSDVPDLLQGMDLFFFPSRVEGLPNALIEAMLSRLPFVTSDIPAILETIPPACHAYAVNPNDFVLAARRIIERLHDPKPHLIQEAAEVCIERYSMEQTLLRYSQRLRS